jgi:hypothetical protein
VGKYISDKVAESTVKGRSRRVKVPKVPEGIDETVKTYERLRWYMQGFAQGKYGLVIVQGRPGISKSQHLTSIMKGADGIILSGQLTPLEVYRLLYKHRGRPIGLDDAEALYDDDAGKRLLRQITETTPVKWPAWISSTSRLGDVPQKYATNSCFCVITNGWIGGPAITSRGLFVYFDPTNEEIHKDAAGWFWDQAIYQYVGERLHLFESLESRHYLKASWIADNDGDWRAYLDHCCHNRTVQVIQQLEADPEYKTVKEKVWKFVEMTGHSRATYYRLKQQLLKGAILTPLAAPPRLDLPLPADNKKPERLSLDDLKKFEEEALHETEGEDKGPASA